MLATFRFVNDADLVPTTPPVDYNHVGQLFHLGPDGTLIAGIIDKIKEKVEDHLPLNYIKALRNLT